MATAGFRWLMVQVLSLHLCVAPAPDAGQCQPGRDNCVADHVAWVQKFTDVAKHEGFRLAEPVSIGTLRLKKEQAWALSQQSRAGKKAEHFDAIADKIMLSMFRDQAKQLSGAEKKRLQQGILNAARTNHTRLTEMMGALCWLDDLNKNIEDAGSPKADAKGGPDLNGMYQGYLNTPEATDDTQTSANDEQDSSIRTAIANAADASAQSIKAAWATVKEKYNDLKKILEPADTDKPGTCGDFAGKWQQSEKNSKYPSKPCEVYSVDGFQDGCSLTAKSDDAWWGHEASLEAVGNSVSITLGHSACDSKVYEATLSEDNTTLAWADGCTWKKIPEAGFLSRHLTALVACLGLVGIVGTATYIHQPSA